MACPTAAKGVRHHPKHQHQTLDHQSGNTDDYIHHYHRNQNKTDSPASSSSSSSASYSGGSGGGGSNSASAAASSGAFKVVADEGDGDPLAPFEWNNMDAASQEEVSLALLNVVELDQEELGDFDESPPSSGQEDNENEANANIKTAVSTDDDTAIDAGNNRKRGREEEHDHDHLDMQHQHQHHLNGHYHTHMDNRTNMDNRTSPTLYNIPTDERPRVSRRRKKNKSKVGRLPKRPMNAFGIFYHEERQKMVESMSESMSEDDIQRQVGKLWRSLSQEEIQKYEKLAEQDKARYREEMEAYGCDGNSTCTKSYGLSKSDHYCQEEPDEDDEDDDEEEEPRHGGGGYSFCLPPPPPGVMVIPASFSAGGGEEMDNRKSTLKETSGAKSNDGNAASNASEAAASGASVSSQAAARAPSVMGRPWGFYGGPLPMAPVPCYPSPVASSMPRGRTVQPSPSYPQMYPYREVSAGSMSPAASTNGGSHWHAAPGSPYAAGARHSYPPPHQQPSGIPPAPPLTPTRSFSPHFGTPGRPAYASPRSQQQQRQRMGFSIPPGMELALPTQNGGEQKYRVSYRCYKMRTEDVHAFMDSLTGGAGAGAYYYSSRHQQHALQPPTSPRAAGQQHPHNHHASPSCIHHPHHLAPPQQYQPQQHW